MRLAWLVPLAVLACKGKDGADADTDTDTDADTDTDSDTDSDADADADTDTDTDTDTDADTDADTDTDTDPGGVSIEDVGYVCDGSDTGALTPSLVATVTGGRVDLVHAEHQMGCCPDVNVAVSGVGNALTATYTLTNDLCDCICELDITYAIEGLPAGSWTLDAHGQSTSFVIP